MFRKTFSIMLAAFMLCTLFVLPVGAADDAPLLFWDSTNKRVVLHEAPMITSVEEYTDEGGTEAYVYSRNSNELRQYADYLFASIGDDDQFYARMLGVPLKDVNASVYIGIQYAYSFDGTNWVNDWAPEYDPEDPYYAPAQNFDRDGDGYNEYVDLGNYTLNPEYLFQRDRLFDAGGGSHLCAAYCWPNEETGMTVQQAIAKRSIAMLQGKGEYLGSYDVDADDSHNGFAIDFSQHTLYVKARYRVYSYYNLFESGEWHYYDNEVSYSPWSTVQTYNNNTRTPAGQGIELNAEYLRSGAAVQLEILNSERREIERDGVKMKATTYMLTFRYPRALEDEMAKFNALGRKDELRDYRYDATGGEIYDPDIVFEIRIGNGNWYALAFEGYEHPYYRFDDDYYGNRNIMEKLGYQPGDRVYLRARLLGSETYYEDYDDETGVSKIFFEDEKHLFSASSNIVELNLTGKYNIEYELNGGSFAHDTTQVYMFDDDTLINVDLTTADYTPTRDHFTFNGWFTTENFASGTQITSFNTAVKQSRTYYAKWTEHKFHRVSYDYGAITGYVYNPNPDKIHDDAGNIEIEDVSYAGAKFLGWYSAKVGGTKVTSLSYAGMGKDVTLYAHWELPSKTITYNGAGTEYTNNKDNPATFQIAPDGDNTVVIYAPEKRGYIFDGWYLNKDLNTGELGYDKEKGGWLLNESENVTLYAKWILGRWDIEYVMNIDGYWNGGNPDQYTFGTAVTLQDPTRNGYTFNGWFTDKELKTKVTQIKADDTGKKTFYAKWTAIQYTIKYDLRDPAIVNFFNNDNPEKRTVDEEVVFKPLAPTNKLYKFLGWYDNVNFDGKPIEKISSGTDRNITVYAKTFRYTWGDVDFDGTVAAADARLVLRCAVGLETFSSDALAWGDVDAHSTKHEISAADARLVLRMAVGLDTPESLHLPELPVGF